MQHMQASNLLYVDQPIGRGFSYTCDKRDIRHNEAGVSNDMYDFLQAFFAEHPQFAKNDFYITGESYAGHYIPALASRVHHGNKAKEGIHINRKGFAISNGLTNPEIQNKAYKDYALDTEIISKDDYEHINKVLPLCEAAIKLCGFHVSDIELVIVLPSAEDEVNVACFHPSAGGGIVYETKEGRVRLLQFEKSA